ncbi:MAG: hypothetical protein ABGX27_08245 [Desulfurobacteriaceae bacterium]
MVSVVVVVVVVVIVVEFDVEVVVELVAASSSGEDEHPAKESIPTKINNRNLFNITNLQKHSSIL